MVPGVGCNCRWGFGCGRGKGIVWWGGRRMEELAGREVWVGDGRVRSLGGVEGVQESAEVLLWEHLMWSVKFLLLWLLLCSVLCVFSGLLLWSVWCVCAGGGLVDNMVGKGGERWGVG